MGEYKPSRGNYAGSTEVGEQTTDTHIFTGSVLISGTLGVTSDITSSGAYNGVFHYESSATDPTTPTPSDGDRYYNTSLGMEMRYDSTRSKWLSVEVGQFDFGRKGNTAAGSYYKGLDSLAYSDADGRVLEYGGTIVSISYTRSDIDSAVFQVTVDGNEEAFISSSASSGYDISLNSDFSQGSIMAARNKSGGNTTKDVAGTVRFKWRAT